MNGSCSRALAIVLWLGVTPGLAQVERLPPPPPADADADASDGRVPWEGPVGRQVAAEESFPRSEAVRPEMIPFAAQPAYQASPPASGPSGPPEFRMLADAAELRAAIAGAADASEPDPDEPPGSRPGVFQKVSFLSTWLATGVGPDDFGVLDLELWSDFGFPCPTRQWPLAVTPGFGVHFFDGAIGADLPGAVYDAYVEFRWLPRLSPRIKLDLGVTPGWYSDFRQGSSDALRIGGHGAAMITWGPTLKLVAGLAYLDRKDVEFLPLGGLIWTPNADTRFELVSPRPRIARRIDHRSAGSVTWSWSQEDWVYVAGEFGGGAWAIRRAGAIDDFITYHDYRILLGVERKRIGGFSARIEVGYVFGRKLQYDGRTPDVEPDDTLLVRGGLTY